ncbi:hypothetical protein [Nonomuraea glycinis]|uniref:hypothetical protein n=1 Tax=Nonomuraea glycinis TaxID=2047744 RepID=UPI0033B69127
MAVDEHVEFQSKGFNLTTRIACATCNNGWMSALEGRTRPLLTSLLRGESQQPDEASLSDVAFWAVKTAIVTAQTGRQKVAVAPEHCQWLYENQGPPLHTVVWMGSYAGGASRPQNWRLHARRLTLGQNDESGISYVGYDWTAGLGALLLKVLLLPPSLWGSPLAIKLQRRARLSQIWPPAMSPVSFPSAEIFSTSDLADLSMELVGSRIDVLEQTIPESAPDPEADNTMPTSA